VLFAGTQALADAHPKHAFAAEPSGWIVTIIGVAILLFSLTVISPV
jgi:hypothetical protein